MLVHVFDDTPHHYIPMQSFFSNRCSINSKQYFWVRSPRNQTNKSTINNECFIIYQDNNDLLGRLKALPLNAQIIFHGLFDIHIWRKLFFLSIAKRCSCVFWGSELYRHTKIERSLKEYLAQFIHMALIKRFNRVITLNPGDKELVSKYLKRANAIALPYPLIGMKKNTSYTKEKSKTLKILVGNSAAASNEHIYALKKLAHLSEENIEVIVPLNYAGKKDYIDDVILSGTKIFGAKFNPITNMLDKKSYDILLDTIDFAVLSHQRQQGLYVAYAMFLLNKAIFLRKKTTSFEYLNSLGFELHTTESLSKLTFNDLQQLKNIDDSKNSQLMDLYFTEEALSPKWSKLLNGLQ